MTNDYVGVMDEVRDDAEGGVADRLLLDLAERVGTHASVRAIFGDPIERGALTVIPVARVRWGFGGGSGSAGDAAGGTSTGSGSGSGGGGGVIADPIGWVEIGSAGATFRPIAPPYPSPVFLLASTLAAATVLRGIRRLLRG